MYIETYLCTAIDNVHLAAANEHHANECYAAVRFIGEGLYNLVLSLLMNLHTDVAAAQEASVSSANRMKAGI